MKIIKFITDAMLGKLTRWLRIFGFDVKYVKDSDKKIMKIACNEERILITSDKNLFLLSKKKGLKSILLKPQNIIEKLSELAKVLNITYTFNSGKTRCPNCNYKIIEIEKEKILNKVPKKTYQYYKNFWICVKCQKYYWQGSHWSKIKQTINQVKITI